MISLHNALPQKVGGIIIKTDWRTWYRFNIELPKATNIYDVAFVLEYQSDMTPELLPELMQFATNENVYPRKDGDGGKKTIDFEQDGEFIYSAFMQKYGIDLIESDMHWHKWLALFRGLFIDYPQIVGFRSYEGADDKDMCKQRRLWSIEEERTDEQLELLEVLKSDGDISKLERS